MSVPCEWQRCQGLEGRFHQIHENIVTKSFGMRVLGG